MSLKLTHKNNSTVGICYSAKSWAQYAIGGDKCIGQVGFKDHSRGEWHAYWHYEKIDNDSPTRYSKGVLSEMSEVREAHVQYIVILGADLDREILRLAKMEEEMADIILQEKEEGNI